MHHVQQQAFSQKAESMGPSPKRRRLNSVEDRVADAKICSDYLSDPTHERSSIESINDFSDWDQILKQSEVIKQMDVPSDILFLIGEFASGQIVECWNCHKKDHVAGLIPVQDELQCDDDWVQLQGAFRGDVDYMCSICYRELICTFCEETVTEHNIECEDCRHVVCSGCDDRHLEEHMDLDIPPPDTYFDELMSGDSYEGYVLDMMEEI